MLSSSGGGAPAGGSPVNGSSNGNGLLNGWGRLLGLVGIPGAIAIYLVWWLTQALIQKLDRIIQLLEQISWTLRVTVS
jgi:hypothetical protein